MAEQQHGPTARELHPRTTSFAIRALMVLGGAMLGFMFVFVLALLRAPDLHHERLIPFVVGGVVLGAVVGFLAGRTPGAARVFVWSMAGAGAGVFLTFVCLGVSRSTVDFEVMWRYLDVTFVCGAVLGGLAGRFVKLSKERP
ncbi:hypothetical protein OOT46_16210 [Aquabacterium sp. A7-Y]|uniref:hypothetical protein n=1 Tax=Aquabacterium sp. A7-Y TaxID=1349605 RepID=UPI00223D8212|nr:hypothetical protein [Aquabacterium sp. A7-Y]MCW7539389.1 hypothetical protein [Aquabacterium sp. A7-Y]